MTLSVLFYIVAIVLFVLSAIPAVPQRINLFHLGWAFVIAAFAFGGVLIAR